MIEGKQFPVLRSVALIVFGMVTSSASSERNFSTTGFIHSRSRNSLKPENVLMLKLVYIKTNAAQLGYGSSTNENGDSDDEQEIIPIDDEE
jgi:hypothetical protein